MYGKMDMKAMGSHIRQRARMVSCLDGYGGSGFLEPTDLSLPAMLLRRLVLIVCFVGD